METEILKTVGQVAGIGGIALGVFLLLFRDIIRKNIFPKLPAAEAYRLLRLIAGAVWSVALVGMSTAEKFWSARRSKLPSLRRRAAPAAGAARLRRSGRELIGGAAGVAAVGWPSGGSSRRSSRGCGRGG